MIVSTLHDFKRDLKSNLIMTSDVCSHESRMIMDLISYDIFFWKYMKDHGYTENSEDNDKFGNYEKNGQKH